MERDMFRFYKAALSGEITTPLCAEYKNAWRKCGDDKEMMVRLVMKEQSLPYFFAHCYQNKGLSKEYILDEFKDYINGRYTGIDVDGVVDNYKTELYVGYDGTLDTQDDVMAMMWCDVQSLRIPTCKAIKVYCACGSDVRFDCTGFNSVIIMLFDDSRVSIGHLDAESNVLVYKYSNTSTVDVGDGCIGNIKIFNKQLKL